MRVDSIEACVEAYFDGIHRGDLASLRRAFHPAARLTGVVQGARYERALADYLAVVEGRASPLERGETRTMRIERIDHVGDVALVRARLSMLDAHYVDFLSLVKDGDRWSIVHKNFTDLPT